MSPPILSTFQQIKQNRSSWVSLKCIGAILNLLKGPTPDAGHFESDAKQTLKKKVGWQMPLKVANLTVAMDTLVTSQPGETCTYYYYKNQFSIIVNLFFWLMLIAYLSSLICRFHIICDGIAVIATYISSSCIALHYRVNWFRQWLKVHLVNSESTQVQYLQVIHRNR